MNLEEALKNHSIEVEVLESDCSRLLKIQNKLIVLYIQKYLLFQDFQNLLKIYPTHLIIWFDTWEKQPQLVISYILYHLDLLPTLPARVGKVSRIERPVATQFLEQHHRLGAVQAKTYWGLFLPTTYYRLLPPNFDTQHFNGLLAVMSFKSPRVFPQDTGSIKSLELLQYAMHQQFKIHGGLNKLLSSISKNASDFDEIMTFVEAGNGAGFKKVGFEMVDTRECLFFRLDEAGNRIKIAASEQPAIITLGNMKMKKYYARPI